MAERDSQTQTLRLAAQVVNWKKEFVAIFSFYCEIWEFRGYLISPGPRRKLNSQARQTISPLPCLVSRQYLLCQPSLFSPFYNFLPCHHAFSIPVRHYGCIPSCNLFFYNNKKALLIGHCFVSDEGIGKLPEGIAPSPAARDNSGKGPHHTSSNI